MRKYTRATWASSTSPLDLLYGAFAAGAPREAVVRAAVACARLVLVHAPPAAAAPVALAEAWATGDATAGALVTARVEVDALARGIPPNGTARYSAVRAAAMAVATTQDGNPTTTAGTCVVSAVGAVTSAAHVVTRAVVGLGGRLYTVARHEAERRLAELIREAIPWSELAPARTKRS